MKMYTIFIRKTNGKFIKKDIFTLLIFFNKYVVKSQIFEYIRTYSEPF